MYYSWLTKKKLFVVSRWQKIWLRNFYIRHNYQWVTADECSIEVSEGTVWISGGDILGFFLMGSRYPRKIKLRNLDLKLCSQLKVSTRVDIIQNFRPFVNSKLVKIPMVPIWRKLALEEPVADERLVLKVWNFV